MQNIKQNLALYIGLGIPLAMILLITVLVYGGSLFNTTPPPQYNFVYAIGDSVIYPSYGYVQPYPANICAKYYYIVASGTVQRIEPTITQNDPNYLYCKGNTQIDVPPKFYIHDVTTDTSTAITFEDLQRYTLDSSAKSPDGYEVVRSMGGGEVFPFFGSSNYDPSQRFLVKDNHSVKLNLQIPRENYYYYGDAVLGWIIK